jgi:hypothetical protein
MNSFDEEILTAYFRSQIKDLNKNNDEFTIFSVYEIMPFPENIEIIFDSISENDLHILWERINLEFYLVNKKPNDLEIKKYIISSTTIDDFTTNYFKKMIENHYPQYLKILNTTLLLK